MSRERRRGYDSLSDADKGYYDDMYKDLPKEVVNILMQTHPLMGKNEDPEATAYRTRRPQRDDLDEIREARMQQVGSEIDEMTNAPAQEGDPTKYVSRRSRYAQPAEEDMYTSAPQGNTMNEDDYEDEIQYVSVMPRKRRSNSSIMEEITIQTAPTPDTDRRSVREDDYEEMSQTSYRRRRYEDIDFERRDKDGHLDNLYNKSGYDEDDDYNGTTSKLPYILGIAALLLIIVLIFRTVSLGSQLQDAKNQITQNESYKEKYEEIQLEKMQLEEQLEGKAPAADDKKEEPAKEEKTADQKQESTGSGATEEYTIVAGDTLWKIAEKTLGNGAEYQKILDANGMKESDNLKIGAKLKIPK